MTSHRSIVLITLALSGMGVAGKAGAETVKVFAAGSLRTLVTALGPRAAASGITIVPVFGGSGTLRDRIEKGEAPDLLLSADMASPEALAKEGRALLSPVAFARNRLCLVARRSLGLNGGDLVARLATGRVRIKTSRPVADPSGDYAMAMFDRMDRAAPGAGKTLRAEAAPFWDAMPSTTRPGESPVAGLFAAGRIDVAVTYCSGSGDIVRSSPDLENIAVPDAYDPRPVFGLALLSSKASAARLALLLLSEAGQSAVAGAGLLPLTPVIPGSAPPAAAPGPR